ncbi:HNH endonuclease [Bacillus sp. C1]
MGDGKEMDVQYRPEPWQHTEVPGKMELVPFGIHNIMIHNGGRSAGMWAYAPR